MIYKIIEICLIIISPIVSSAVYSFIELVYHLLVFSKLIACLCSILFHNIILSYLNLVVLLIVLLVFVEQVEFQHITEQFHKQDKVHIQMNIDIEPVEHIEIVDIVGIVVTFDVVGFEFVVVVIVVAVVAEFDIVVVESLAFVAFVVAVVVGFEAVVVVGLQFVDLFEESFAD